MDHAGDSVGNVVELEVKENGRRWCCSLYSSDSCWAERTEEFETELDAHAVERGQRRTEGDGILFVGRVDGDEEARQHREVWLSQLCHSVSQLQLYFTVPPRAHPSAGSQSGSAAPVTARYKHEVKSSQVKHEHQSPKEVCLASARLYHTVTGQSTDTQPHAPKSF